MTIRPKKKAVKDKNEADSRESPRSPSTCEPRVNHVNRHQGNSPPPRWNSPAPLDERKLDPGGRFEDHHETSSSHKRRHRGDRTSPHRTSRKLRHTNSTAHDRQTRSDRSASIPLWVETPPGTSHSTHSPHTKYNEVSEHCHKPSNEDEGGYNSEDEYSAPTTVLPQLGQNVSSEELERCFEATMKEKRGFLIKAMGEDGACMFRAVADQVFGDQEMHSVVRRNCVDYMAKNSDYFRQYITEDFHSYLNRKRMDHCHGNHIEMQALCELYNRPIEVYQYSIDPINTFHGAYKTGSEPIRLSYHGNHYNSVVDPKSATVGVGLGLPGYQPGLAERNQMSDAKRVSEDFHIEQAMLADKMRETDWEVTQESIDEQVARESYLQWLREQEKRSKGHDHTSSASATCSSSCSASADACTSSSLTPVAPTAASVSCPQQPQRSPEHALMRSNRSPRHKGSANNSAQNSPAPYCLEMLTNHSSNTAAEGNPAVPHTGTSYGMGAVGGATDDFCVSEYVNSFNPAMYGLSDWDEDDIMAQVIARSQQEYMDSLKQQQSASHHRVTTATESRPSTSIAMDSYASMNAGLSVWSTEKSTDS